MTAPSIPEATNLVAARRLLGERRDIHDPGHPETVVGTVHDASRATVDAAVDAAAAAAPEWAATPWEECAAAVRAAGKRLAARTAAADWATLLTSEQGKILAESRFEVDRAPAVTDLFADLAAAALRAEVLADERGRREVTREPVGPVAAITPWNWPVSLSTGKVVPALLAGNPVIVKPAPNTPLTVTEIVTALADELPPALIGIVQGGGQPGAALAEHPGARKIVFTGSTTNGARVYAAAAGTVKYLTLELGGNDPTLVLEDADLSEATLATMLASTFLTSGQVCWAIKRIYVHRSRVAEFTEVFRAAVDALVVGHGLHRETTMGPLNNPVQRDLVDDLVRRAEQDGATVHVLDERRAGGGGSEGYYRRPTVVTDLGDDADLVRREQFGPMRPSSRSTTSTTPSGGPTPPRTACAPPCGRPTPTAGSRWPSAARRAGLRQRPCGCGSGLHPGILRHRTERPGPGVRCRRGPGVHRGPHDLRSTIPMTAHPHPEPGLTPKPPEEP